MRRVVLSTLVPALVLGALSCWSAPAASAEDLKTLAVISLSSYDEMLGDVGMVGRLSGRPGIEKQLEAMLALFTKGQGLAGLDKKRPCGAVLLTDGKELSGCGLVPVTDLKKLLAVVEPYAGKVEEVDGGVLKIQTRHRPLYVKQKHGWALVSDRRETLDAVRRPAARMIRELAGQYDVAVRMNLCNVPAEHREKFAAHVKEHAARHLRQRHHEDDKLFAVHKKMSKQMLKCALKALGEVEQVTLGWSLDHDVEKAILEATVTAVAETDTARKIAQLASTRTRFAGFSLPGAVLSGHGTFEFQPPGEEDLAVIFDALGQQACRKIDAKEKDEEKAKVAKQVVGGLLNVVRDTIAGGRADGAGSLMLSPDSATLVAARHLASGPDLEEVLEKIVRAVRKEHPDFVDKVLKVDADKYKGVRFHVVSIRIPKKVKDRDKVVHLIGENLDVVVGIAPQAVYVAAGRDALKTLKQAIEQSEAKGHQTVAPMEVSLDLGQLAAFMAEVAGGRDRERAARVLAALEKSPEADQVNLAVVPVSHGVKLRLELQPGVLQAMGAMHGKK